MELFDLVNENDEIVGVTSKEESHKKKYIHRIVTIYAFTPDGKLYIQNHLKNKVYDHSVGGHIKQGETYQEAAKREAMEELNISDRLSTVTTFYSSKVVNGLEPIHMCGVFECIVSPLWKFIPNKEVNEIFPLYLAEVIDKMNKTPTQFSDDFIRTMSEYIKIKRLPYLLNI